MREELTVRINGREVSVPRGTSVAAALLNGSESAFRRSVSGEGRGPLCGMGVCFECRVRINGVAHQRACMVECEPGMEIRTHG